LCGVFFSQFLFRKGKILIKDGFLARTNYSFEKRQKELAKKKKNEEKKLRRLEKQNEAAGDKNNLSPQDD
jgi:uncharacterized membrane protein (DUF106 family)